MVLYLDPLGTEKVGFLDPNPKNLQWLLGPEPANAGYPPPNHMEAHKRPCVEDSSLTKGPSPLECEFGGAYVEPFGEYVLPDSTAFLVSPLLSGL